MDDQRSFLLILQNSSSINLQQKQVKTILYQINCDFSYFCIFFSTLLPFFKVFSNIKAYNNQSVSYQMNQGSLNDGQPRSVENKPMKEITISFDSGQQIKDIENKPFQTQIQKSGIKQTIKIYLVPFIRTYTLPQSISTKLEPTLKIIMSNYITNMMTNKFYIAYYSQTQNASKHCKLYLALNIFINTLALSFEVKEQIIDKKLISFREDKLKKYIVKVVEDLYEKSSQKLAKAYPMPKQLDRIQKKILNIQWTRNEEYDIFVRFGIKYTNSIQYLYRIINHVLKISNIPQQVQNSQKKTIFKQFINFNELINSHKGSSDTLQNICKNIRKLNWDEKCIVMIGHNKKIEKPESEIHQQNSQKESFQKLAKIIKKKSNKELVRILTKFIEQNQKIFQKPQILIQNRNYPFKDSQNNIIFLDSDTKLRLCKQIKQANRDKLDQIKENYFNAETQLIFNMKDFKEKPFQTSILISQKIYQIFVQTILEYAVELINVLVTAGRFQDEYGTNFNINLVIFNVKDLYRSSIQCQKIADFEKIIDILNQLNLPNEEGSMQQQKIFKIINISNKLNKNRSILVNYLFQNSVVCQLQLKYLGDDQKRKQQKKQQEFSHFIYEFTRGSLGITSEIISIIFTEFAPVIVKTQAISLIESAHKPKNNRIVQEINKAKQNTQYLPYWIKKITREQQLNQKKPKVKNVSKTQKKPIHLSHPTFQSMIQEAANNIVQEKMRQTQQAVYEFQQKIMMEEEQKNNKVIEDKNQEIKKKIKQKIKEMVKGIKQQINSVFSCQSQSNQQDDEAETQQIFNRQFKALIKAKQSIFKSKVQDFSHIFEEKLQQIKKIKVEEIQEEIRQKEIKLKSNSKLKKQVLSNQQRDSIIQQTIQDAKDKFNQKTKKEVKEIPMIKSKSKDAKSNDDDDDDEEIPSPPLDQAIVSHSTQNPEFVKTINVNNIIRGHLFPKINQAVNLRYLVLRNCSIFSIGQLNLLILTQKLKQLILADNQLQYMSQFQNETCFSLEKLDLSNNKFVQKKDSSSGKEMSLFFKFIYYPKLKYLNIAKNDFNKIQIGAQDGQSNSNILFQEKINQKTDEKANQKIRQKYKHILGDIFLIVTPQNRPSEIEQDGNDQ